MAPEPGCRRRVGIGRGSPKTSGVNGNSTKPGDTDSIGAQVNDCWWPPPALEFHAGSILRGDSLTQGRLRHISDAVTG